MKRTLLLILALLTVVTCHYAQTGSETVEYSTESKKESDFKIGKKYRYFDRNHIEEKSMLRFGLSQSFNLASSLFLDYEMKIKKRSALSLGLIYDPNSSLQLSPERSGITAAYKFFYSANKKNEGVDKANNLNGSFVSFQYNKNIPDWNKETPFDATNFKLLWGLQKRLGRYGYIEFNTGLSYTHKRFFYRLKDPNVVDFSPEAFEKVNAPLGVVANLKLGFAIGNLVKNNRYDTPYLTKVKSKMRSMTNQLREEKTLFKIGVRGIGLLERNFALSTTLSVERKLTPSLGLIVENDVSLSVLSERDFIPVRLNPVRLNIHGGLRYYYSMNKRITRGLSANNFSANYISVMGLNLYESKNFKTRFKQPLNRRVALLWGLQRRIGKVGFVDFNSGLSYNIRNFVGFESRLSVGIGW